MTETHNEGGRCHTLWFTVTSGVSCFGVSVLPVGDAVIAAQSPPPPTALDRFGGRGPPVMDAYPRGYGTFVERILQTHL